MVRAINSLPVPVSPVISTVSLCPATRSTIVMNRCITGLARRKSVPSTLRLTIALESDSLNPGPEMPAWLSGKLSGKLSANTVPTIAFAVDFES